jgi:2-polyprenyl-3-methyl-5-hydroxy-6-metoxy-1,4-benzoquinol methylase
MNLLEPQKKIFETKDFTVSDETFDLYANAKENILITQPQPTLDKLPNYYSSEDYISHTDATFSVFDKLYQMVKRYMLKKKAKWIEDLDLSGNRILDIGAGTGSFLQFMSTRGWDIVGVEPNQKARALANDKGIKLQNDLSAIKKQFDVISLWHVLEHLPGLPEQLEQIKKLLHKNGKLVIAVPNYTSYDAQYYQSFWAAFDVPRHLWHFSPDGLISLLNQYDLKLVKTHPLKFDAFYVSWLSEKNKTTNNLFKAFWVATKSNYRARHSNAYSSLVYIFERT